MICEACETKNPSTARFCGHCGAKFPAKKSGFLVWLVTSETPGWKGMAIIALKLIAALYIFLFLLGVLLMGGF